MTSVPRSPAAAPLEPGSGGRLLLSEGILRVVVRVLHAAFVVIVGALLANVLLTDLDGSRPVLLAAVAVWVAGYAALAVPALAGRHVRLETGYVVVLVAVVAVLAAQQPSLLFVMFLAYPQVWFFTGSLRAGVLWSVVLALAGTVAPAIGWAGGTQPLWGPGETLVGLALSLALGLWTTRVLEQSAERAELIRELESTRAELAAAHHAQGVVAERERWAREVHDTLAQGYTSIVVLAQTAAAQLDGDPAAAAERVALIEEVARENLAEARAMVAAFAPVALDSATLVEALRRLAERFGRETGLATRVDTAALDETALDDGDTGLTRAEEIVLLRGAQEALANVRRHAAATAVVLRIARVGPAGSAQVSVHVEDDGVGFDPAVSPGVGLAGLRDRAEQVGGAVDVVSAPGEGTRVTVRVPVR